MQKLSPPGSGFERHRTGSAYCTRGQRQARPTPVAERQGRATTNTPQIERILLQYNKINASYTIGMKQFVA